MTGIPSDALQGSCRDFKVAPQRRPEKDRNPILSAPRRWTSTRCLQSAVTRCLKEQEWQPGTLANRTTYLREHGALRVSRRNLLILLAWLAPSQIRKGHAGDCFFLPTLTITASHAGVPIPEGVDSSIDSGSSIRWVDALLLDRMFSR